MLPTPPTTAMTALLSRPAPALGVFWPAAWPTTTASIDALHTMIEAGAEYVEVGAGTDPGQPVLADVIATAGGIVRTRSRVPVAVRVYWDVLAQASPTVAAAALARAGVSAITVPDLPAADVSLWIHTATRSGLYTPRVAWPVVTDSRLATVCRGATGWICTSAADTRTRAPGLREFVPRIRATTRLPIVIGTGRATVGQAVRISRLANAILVGTTLLQRVRAAPGPKGRAHAAQYVEALAGALRAEYAARTV